MRSIPLFLILSLPLLLNAQDAYVISNTDRLYRINVNNCEKELVTSLPSDLNTDIAFHPNGDLYGISAFGELYRIDTLQGSTLIVHEFPAPSTFYIYNSLVIDKYGLVYVGDQQGNIFTFDLNSNNEILIGNVGFELAGDFIFINNILYASTTTEELIQINLNSPVLSFVVIGNVTTNSVYGLFPYSENCEDIIPYAIGTNSFENQSTLYRIQLTPNEFIPECIIDFGIYGATSTVEFSNIPINIDDIIISPSTCGAESRSITIEASGGFGELNYSIDGINFQVENRFENLSPGVYEIIIRDRNKCNTSQLVSLDINIQIIGSLIIDNTICEEGNGTLVIPTVNGTPPFLYSIDGVNYQESAQFIDLNSGDYTIFVLDANNCGDTTNAVIQFEPSPIIEKLIVENTICGENNGSIIVNATGGTGQLSYAINDQNFQSPNTFTNLPAGNFRIQIIDENDCLISDTVQIAPSTSLQLLSVNTEAAECGIDNGQLLLSIDGGTGDVLTSINGSNISPDLVFENLSKGIYLIEIFDEAACTIDTSIIIGQTDCPLYIPNAFSPNDDGFNDLFQIYPHPNFVGQFFSIHIFNRWGSLVYSLEKVEAEDIRWNGSILGKPLNPGIFSYFLEYVSEEGEKVILKGDITLMR